MTGLERLTPIAEYHGVDAARFRAEIMPRGRPAVLRGLVADWPAVARSNEALAAWLEDEDQGAPVDVLTGDPDIEGRLFYRPDMRSLNFTRAPRRIGEVARSLIAHLGDSRPPAISAQSIEARRFLPGFEAENPFELLPGVPARLWLGNAVEVAPHIDIYENIACVVAGRRCFVLFPPEQLPNLYVGPFDFSPAGAPVSMVPLGTADFERYPCYRDALAAAETAELGPGDAIYVPYMWWHGVRSLEPFNLLVNYWWNEARPKTGPYDALMHALLAFRDMPAAHREAWRTMFETYVFQAHGEPMAHLPPEARGAMGGLDERGVAAMKAHLARALSRG